EHDVRCDLHALVDHGLAMAAEAGFRKEPGSRRGREGSKEGDGEPAYDPRAALLEFFEQRLKFLLEESGIRQDAATALLAAGWVDAGLTWHRGRALNALRGQDDFLALAAAAKRVRNILAQAAEKGLGNPDAGVDPAVLKAGVESDLRRAMERSRGEAERLGGRGDFKGALTAVAALRPVVDRFFDEVLVMDPDERVRN